MFLGKFDRKFDRGVVSHLEVPTTEPSEISQGGNKERFDDESDEDDESFFKTTLEMIMEDVSSCFGVTNFFVENGNWNCAGAIGICLIIFVLVAIVVFFVVFNVAACATAGCDDIGFNNTTYTHPLRTVECYTDSENKTLTIQKWLKQDGRKSIDLCDPNFLPPRHTLDVSKPVKVFILLGQSNMLGMGITHGINDTNSLEYLVRHGRRYQHLNVWEGARRSQFGVRHVAVNQDFQVHTNDWLRVPPFKEKENPQDPGVTFGIELQFGYIMGELMDDHPVLLIKSCMGNRALGWDLLPPGVGRYNDSKGYTYPAYGEKPEKWLTNSSKPNVPNLHWYAGKEYDDDVRNAKKILANMDTYFPGLFPNPSYEIAGFVWWQGCRDTFLEGHAYQYESNLVRLIDSLRHDFGAAKAKFLIATIGYGGYKMKEFSKRLEKEFDSDPPYLSEVWEAQMAVNNYTKYPQFRGNAQAVDIRSSWRKADIKELYNWAHYNQSASVYMEVGNILGWAMANLLSAK